ncbi:MAG: Gfo/Idh/MocA family oxidoreductase [Bacteroidales bacterium]
MNSAKPSSVSNVKQEPSSPDRRKFIGTVAATAVGLTVVPRHVLGGKGYTAPSDKVNVAYIGVGTQGLRELGELLELPDVQVTAVCDAQLKAINYYDWDPESLRNMIRSKTGNPTWNTGGNNSIPGGLECGKYLIDGYYAKKNPGEKLTGCKAYTDFRELFAKEKPDAVKVLTTDHVHGIIAMAAIKRGISVTLHKPISNRLHEGKRVIDMAGKSDVVTHLIPWDVNGNMDQVMDWINGGKIGNLKEIHNWSYRPVWPQYHEKPADTPRVPKGFDWDLWLGPEAYRPYHPHYTNMVFRGWYDFGGGSMADMGHYSLWCVFNALELEGPVLVEPNMSHVCNLIDNTTANKIANDFSFPHASSVRFRYPATSKRQAVDLFWYDGGMRPQTPAAFFDQGVELPSEGMMFIGENGIIMSSQFLLREPYLLADGIKPSEDVPPASGAVKLPGIRRFIDGVKTGQQIDGSFRQAWPITEAVNLYAAALRSGSLLKYDPKQMKITNNEAANKYLSREYRTGWEPEKI